jgi:subtilisin family serine protease
MKTLLALLTTLLIAPLGAKQLKVAVIDTGVGFKAFKHKNVSNLCEAGHKNFTKEPLYDIVGHGANVSGIISKYAQGANYCQIVYKYWTRKLTPQQSVNNMIKAIQAAIEAKVDFINISAGGTGFYYEEMLVVKEALNRGIIIIAAAGNNGGILQSKSYSNFCTEKSNVGKIEEYYPAMYDPRIIVVGSKNELGKISTFSNRGCYIDVWEVGERVSGIFKRAELTGTSQATAIHTGKMIYERSKKKESGSSLPEATKSWQPNK